MTHHPRRRTVAAVFLTVLLTGSGVTSAAALWSQQASVATTIATGTWGDTTPPQLAWNPVVNVTPENDNSAHLGLRITWSPVEGKPSTTYTATLTPADTIQKGPEYGTDRLSAWFRLHKDEAAGRYALTLVATVDGVQVPAKRTLTIAPDGTMTLQ